MKKIKERRGEEGVALVITLLVMTILLIMGSAFMSISSTETLIAINERNRIQAYHLAEAGAEMAITQLNANSNYAGTGEQPLGPGTYTVTVTCLPVAPFPCPPATPDQRLISATGCVRNCAPGSAMSTVEMRVQRGPFQFAMLAAGPGDSSDRAVNLENSVQVDSYDSAVGPYDPLNPGTQGRIHSNGDIELGTDSLVKGNARAVGMVTLGSGSTIEGGYTPGVASEGVANITPPPPTGDLTVADNQTVTLTPGTYSFDRITIGTDSKLDITGPVVIYVTGRFFAGRGAKINASAASTRKPTDLLIFSSNTGTDAPPAPINGEEAFFFCCNDGSESGEFYGGIYAPNGEVEFQNATDPNQGWNIYGSIVAKKIDIEEHARLHYDVALARASIPGFPPTGKFRPTAGTWQERLPSN